jgi:hypothetical protein
MQDLTFPNVLNSRRPLRKQFTVPFQTLDWISKFIYVCPMEKVIEKFSNQDWFFRIIFVVIVVLTLHVQFFSSYMGR